MERLPLSSSILFVVMVLTCRTYSSVISMQSVPIASNVHRPGAALLPTAPTITMTNTLYLPEIAWYITSTPATAFLPLVLQQPTPTPLPQWERLSLLGQEEPMDVTALIVQTDGDIFVGDQRKGEAGGIYVANVSANCLPNKDFRQVQGSLEVLDISFNERNGLAGTFGNRIYYSEDIGNTWLATESTNMNAFAFAVVFKGTHGYSGNDDGIYQSTNNGRTWTKVPDGPQLINVLQVQNNTIWIGTYQSGVWVLENGQFTPKQFNLPTVRVWDIVFQENNIFLATNIGVYKGDGNSDWQAVGLQESEIYGLAIGDMHLFAGVHNGGVQKTLLVNGIPDLWQPVTNGVGWNPGYSVRNLLYDTEHCQGLLVATNDGIWVLHSPTTTNGLDVSSLLTQNIEPIAITFEEEYTLGATEQKTTSASIRRKR